MPSPVSAKAVISLVAFESDKCNNGRSRQSHRWKGEKSPRRSPTRAEMVRPIPNPDDSQEEETKYSVSERAGQVRNDEGRTTIRNRKVRTAEEEKYYRASRLYVGSSSFNFFEPIRPTGLCRSRWSPNDPEGTGENHLYDLLFRTSGRQMGITNV